jgi:serine/threonine protein kinase
MAFAYVDLWRRMGRQGIETIMQPEPDTQVIPPRDGRAETALPDRQGEPAAERERTPGSPRGGLAENQVEPVILQRWVGRYELIHRLAHGGMATVYLGRAKGKAGFEKVVAVKVIHPHLAAEAEFVGMFLDEARIAARIHHPHVVEILDLGESNGAYYMVMEFIEGENLAALVRALEGEPLPIAVVLQILADTLEGLGAAHELRDADGRPYQLVHRDISPHNILINLDGWSKVGDFGIMKAAGKASNTKTGELRGKLAYMSPEQARGEGRVDHRTDLFAVGVIGWELLTGRRLFGCPTEAATLEKVIACEVPPLGVGLGEGRPELEGHPQLHAGLDALLGRALARDPARRWADAAEMLAEVKRMLRLADELPPSEVAAIDPRDQLGKAMRRFFLRRVDYARAALRRTGEHDALVTSPRKWLVDPTQPVMRSPSDGHTAADPSSDTDPVSATVTDEPELSGSRELTRLPTGPQLELEGSATQTLVARGAGTHWLMWLLLPMLGAGIAVAAMLAIGPGLQPSVEPSAGSEPSASPPVTGEAETASDIARRSPATLAAGEYSTVPKKPPGTIRWWFSTSPKGAQVFIDGEPNGTTPTYVHVPIGEQPLDIRLELAGYEPHTFQVPPANDQTFAPQLLPLADVSDDKPASKKRVRKSSAPAQTSPTEVVPTSTPGKKSFVPVPDSLRDSG